MDATVETGEQPARNSTGAFAPLAVTPFRRIWAGSLLANFGHLIMGVAAAWQMVRLTDSATLVAMVQTALLLPLMLVALPAGALADMFDRRKVALTGLGIAVCGSATLVTLSVAEAVTPTILLAMLFAIGCGVALYGPAWQSSLGELVPPVQLPAAVSLGSVSYNLARSFGPAIGGVIVLAAGARAAYATNTLGYLPFIIAFLLWRRVHVASRLPPESFFRALVSGFRYAIHAPGVRNAVVRSFLFGFAGATTAALAPLIAAEQLQGNASTYGLLLGASGVGAVFGSLATAPLRQRLAPEIAVRFATIGVALALTGIGLAQSVVLACALFMLQGLCTMLIISMFNVGVQLSAPRWVTARALSIFSSALTGGIAIGALVWGMVAEQIGIGPTVVVSGAVMAGTLLFGFVFPLPRDAQEDLARVEIHKDPEVRLAITARSGPIMIAVDYRIEPPNARDFYRAMQDVRRSRLRNGAFGWSIARDIADPELWTERYVCPTWGDYLRLRDRFTAADLEAQEAADAFNTMPGGNRVRRRLERPFGSVRWKAETPDPGHQQEGVYNH